MALEQPFQKILHCNIFKTATYYQKSLELKCGIIIQLISMQNSRYTGQSERPFLTVGDNKFERKIFIYCLQITSILWSIFNKQQIDQSYHMHKPEAPLSTVCYCCTTD